MLVADLMETDVMTTSPSTTLKELDELFTTHAISGAPVIDDGMLVGVVSQTDVVRVLHDAQMAAADVSQFLLSPFPSAIPALTEIARERAAIADRMVSLTVADAMTPVPVTVAPEDDISEAARKMCEERIHRVLVTDRGGLVGILSALDLVGTLVEDL